MDTSCFFSVVVPTYNRPKQLADCLQSVALLDYSREKFEVIVVDDGSDESLDKIVKRFVESINIRLIRQTNSGPAAARNHGAQYAQGKFLAFTDDDCEPTVNWLSILETHCRNNSDCIVGGQTKNLLAKDLYPTASQNIIDVVYRHYNLAPQGARFFASNNMTVPTQDFLELGGFDIRFRTSEDREFCDRWLDSGRRMIYVPEVSICHAHPMTLRQFWHQHFSYGQGAFNFHRERAETGRGEFKVEGNFYWSLLMSALDYRKGWRVFPLLWALGVAQVANATGFFWEMGKARNGRKLLGADG